MEKVYSFYIKEYKEKKTHYNDYTIKIACSTKTINIMRLGQNKGNLGATDYYFKMLHFHFKNNSSKNKHTMKYADSLVSFDYIILYEY